MSPRTRQVTLASYVVVLLALTLAPLPETAYRLTSWPGFDKAVHFGLFGGFALLLYWNLLLGGRPSVWWVLGSSAALAALIEGLQGQLGYRTSDGWDFFGGVAGSLAAYLAGSWMRRRPREPGGRSVAGVGAGDPST